MNYPSYSTAEARKNFADIINTTSYGKERIILTRHGKEIMAMVPIEDIKLLEWAEDQYDGQMADEAKAESGHKGYYTWDEVKKELKLI